MMRCHWQETWAEHPRPLAWRKPPAADHANFAIQQTESGPSENRAIKMYYQVNAICVLLLVSGLHPTYILCYVKAFHLGGFKVCIMVYSIIQNSCRYHFYNLCNHHPRNPFYYCLYLIDSHLFIVNAPLYTEECFFGNFLII